MDWVISRLSAITGITLRRCGKGYKGKALWRGDKEPSLSVFQSNGEFFYKDFATGESGHITQLLTRHYQMDFKEARRALGLEDAITEYKPPTIGALKINLPAARETPEYKEVPEDVAALFNKQLAELPEELRRRGFGPSVLNMHRFALVNGDLAFPIIGPDGVWRQVKVRRQGNEARYRYLVTGAGSPSLWLGPSDAPAVLIVEGELNALAYHYTFQKMGGYVRVVGLPGASYTLTKEDLEHLRDKVVWIDTDADVPGRELRDRINHIIREEGNNTTVLVYSEDNLHRDACEILACSGHRGLWESFNRRCKEQKRTQLRFKSAATRISSYVKGMDNKREVFSVLGVYGKWSKGALPKWAFAAMDILKNLRLKVVPPSKETIQVVRIASVLATLGGTANSISELYSNGGLAGRGSQARALLYKMQDIGLVKLEVTSKHGRLRITLADNWQKVVKRLLADYIKKNIALIRKRVESVVNPERFAFWSRYYSWASKYSAWVRERVTRAAAT